MHISTKARMPEDSPLETTETTEVLTIQITLAQYDFQEASACPPGADMSGQTLPHQFRKMTFLSVYSSGALRTKSGPKDWYCHCSARPSVLKSSMPDKQGPVDQTGHLIPPDLPAQLCSKTLLSLARGL